MKFYADSYSKWGNDVRSLGRGSKESQQKRFSVLLQQEIEAEDTILDVGCGFADLKSYLLDNGLDNQYIGVEREEHFREVASQNHRDIKMYASTQGIEFQKYDWVFASGIFCFAPKDGTCWISDTATFIDSLHSRAKKATVVNFLYGKGTNEKMHYTNLRELSEIINIIAASKFNICGSYKQNDISLILYK